MNIDFSQYGVGLRKDEPVALAPYDARWVDCAARMIAHVRVCTTPCHIDLQHIGSTAVPGLQAKPVIDLLGVVRRFGDFEDYRDRFERAGWEWRGENGIAGRRYLVLQDKLRHLRFAHLHVFENGNREIDRHLLFRDTLRRDAAKATQYQALKEKLAADSAQDNDAYASGKSDFVRDILTKEGFYK